MNNYLKFLLLLVGVAVLGYAGHTLVLTKLDVQVYWEQTGYTLSGLYTFFGVASLLVVLLLCGVKYAMPTYVAFAFLAGFVLKALTGYLFIRHGFGLLENDFLEYNFLTVFFLFLFFDVYVAYVLVNQDTTTAEK
ncbi:hypothetical protein [Sphingobacterium wenxiniae]|uniref:Uncharacterized protein n=1 Tax=Sphingobacterium wenxiniae TaxID=683125 RepID=A0A1I6VBJ9_9SPHI|nr:hypothetical protein [Sphingobacterium wenxiniae]SFT11096.1 hypothetical protein SAMN05660206_11289 [Sphingobacterium wenxiniae]